MKPNYSQKATIQEIRERFDKDTERFSNLETGQVATIDAPLTMDLCTEAAKYATPAARELLDIGCGAGNLGITVGTFCSETRNFHSI